MEQCLADIVVSLYIIHSQASMEVGLVILSEFVRLTLIQERDNPCSSSSLLED